MEAGDITLIGATTENPSFEVNSALLSRTKVVVIPALEREQVIAILERAVGYLRLRGIAVDLATLPLDDAKTYEMLARGDAGGVFQLEGQGMRDALRQMRPRCFEDPIAMVALLRPAPLATHPAYSPRRPRGARGAAPPADHPGVIASGGTSVGLEQEPAAREALVADRE